MHELALEQRRELGVRAPWHVGDVTWGLRQHEGREAEWKIRVWKDGERTVAWSWLKGDRALLEFDVRRDRLDLLDEILADPDARTAVAFEDDGLGAFRPFGGGPGIFPKGASIFRVVAGDTCAVDGKDLPPTCKRDECGRAETRLVFPDAPGRGAIFAAERKQGG